MLTLTAPAKVNLFLHITGKRPDGYHLLQSLVVFTDFGDELTLTPADQDRLTISGPFVSALQGEAPESNLLMQALRGLRNIYPSLGYFHVTLQKNLPIGGGVGGGSSDAAALIRALEKAECLTEPSISPAALAPLLTRLGADVPVCYAGQTALIESAGETFHIWPPAPRWGIILVNPCIPLLTSTVFRMNTQFSPATSFPLPASSTDWQALLHKTHNDLQPAAIQALPVIQTILERIASSPECLLARMSGSGSTCFGLYPDADQAKQAAQLIQHAHPEWWVYAGNIDHARTA